MVSKMYGPQIAKPIKAEHVGQLPAHVQQQRASLGKTEFQRILQEKASKVEFSAHAMKRLAQRDINLTETDVKRINDAVEKASGKGSKESLVLLNGMAFVVSVSNRTVITAIDMDSMKENVVTNIDSAVIA